MADWWKRNRPSRAELERTVRRLTKELEAARADHGLNRTEADHVGRLLGVLVAAAGGRVVVPESLMVGPVPALAVSEDRRAGTSVYEVRGG